MRHSKRQNRRELIIIIYLSFIEKLSNATQAKCKRKK